jgi:DNA-binding CsgD family transcriptional regulator
VRASAQERGDERVELAANLELGQALLRSPIGEGYAPTPLESDLDGAEAAYEAALALAERLNDRQSLAGATRELGVIITARVRAWFIDRFRAGEQIEILRHVASGGSLDEVIQGLPIYPDAVRALGKFQQALELYEALGDRRGAMSTIIAMAYGNWAPDVHVGASPARRIEEIRRLATRLQSLSVESERNAAELQMLYGVHVFARAKVIPDLAIERGREVYTRARALGDRSVEFLAADGTAAAYLDIGDVREAAVWVERAASAAAASPTPTRARQIEVTRGLLAEASGDTAAMRSHFQAALDATAGQDRRAARTEILAMAAIAGLRSADAAQDDATATALRADAESQAMEALRLVEGLPGRPPWPLQAQVVLAAIALERGERDNALALARSALAARAEAMREDPHLETLLLAARVLLAEGSEAEATAVRDELQLLQALIGQRTLDGDVRALWFRGPCGRELARLAGPFEPSAGQAAAMGPSTLDARQQRLLGLLIEGFTNVEIAAELGDTPEGVAQQLATMYAAIGATSRAEATVMALTGAV